MHELLQFPIRENLSNILASAPAEIQPFPASAEVVATIEESAAQAWVSAVKELLDASEQVQKSLELCKIMGWPADLDTRCARRFAVAIEELKRF